MENTLIEVMPVLFTGVLAPIAVALIKKILPDLPSWMLPLIAVLGPTVVDSIATMAVESLVGSPLLAAIGGAMGIGIREVYDQLKKVL